MEYDLIVEETHTCEQLPDHFWRGQILTGNSAASDTLRWLFASHDDNTQIDREFALSASDSDPETWEKVQRYGDAYEHDALRGVCGFESSEKKP